MAILKNKKLIDCANNESQITKVVYDFAVDGGTIASYEVAEATSDTVIEAISCETITALDSAADAITVDLGITGSTTAFLSGSAQSNFEAGDFTAPAETFVPVKLAKNAKVLMEFKVAAATVGKICITIVTRKFGL
jgi:hypothetical protein